MNAIVVVIDFNSRMEPTRLQPRVFEVPDHRIPEVILDSGEENIPVEWNSDATFESDFLDLLSTVLLDEIMPCRIWVVKQLQRFASLAASRIMYPNAQLLIDGIPVEVDNARVERA